MKKFVAREVRTLVVCLSTVLLCSSSLVAQGQQRLRIVVIEGEDAVNVIQQKTAVAPIVEVRDRNNNPVAGAAVTFAVKGGGAKATLGNGVRQVVVTTDAAGRASVAVNPVANGSLEIEASVSSGGQTATATIAQTNVATPADAAKASSGGGHTGLIITGAALGGAGIAGAKYYEKYKNERVDEPIVDVGCAMGRVGNPISAPAQGGTFSITFNVTCKWFATVENWMSVTPSSGDGSGTGLDLAGGQDVTLTLTVQPNTTPAARSGMVSLHNALLASWGPFNIAVNQAAAASAFILPGRAVVAMQSERCAVAAAIDSMRIQLDDSGGAMTMALSSCGGVTMVKGRVARSGDRITGHVTDPRGAIDIDGVIVGHELRATMNVAGATTSVVLVENQ